MRPGLNQEEAAYQSCLDALPNSVRRQLQDSKQGMRRFNIKDREKISACLDLRRLRDDVIATSKLKKDLESFFAKEDLSQPQKDEMQKEAGVLASSIIKTTNLLDKKFDMGSFALWNNAMIKMGVKKGGYCYHWTEGLLKALPQERLNYFERHWGVHNEAQVTENNTLIITRRGGSVAEGIVYDAWRGKGEPYWKFVKDDTQSWSERYSERDILDGQIW